MATQFTLLGDRRFAPLFVTQFLGAFNDNLFKTLLVVMVAYGVLDSGGWKPEILVSLAAALFILPFVTFAALGGTLADKFDKDRIIRLLKLAEIVIVAGAVAGLLTGLLPLLFVVLFALGVQSALLSPSKFAILPQALSGRELIGANGLMNTGGFIAILLGTVLGSLWGLDEQGHLMALVTLVVCALVGYLVSRFIPQAKAPEPDLHIGWTMIGGTVENFRYALAQHRSVMIAIFGIAWFYFVGGTFLAQFPNFAKQTLGVDNIVLTVFMCVFTCGIALGGLMNNRLLKATVSAKFVPAAALGITIFTGDLYGAARDFAHDFDRAGEELLSLAQFLGPYNSWRIVFDIFMVSVCGGLFVVPLNALLQDRAPDAIRARILSVSTLVSALFILLSAVMAIGLFALSFEVVDLFFVLSMATGAVALYFGFNRTIFEDGER